MLKDRLIVQSFAFLTAAGLVPHDLLHPTFDRPLAQQVAVHRTALNNHPTMRQWRVLAAFGHTLVGSDLVRHNSTSTLISNEIPHDVALQKANAAVELIKEKTKLTPESLEKVLNSSKPLLLEKKHKDGFKSIHTLIDSSLRRKYILSVEMIAKEIQHFLTLDNRSDGEILETIWRAQTASKVSFESNSLIVPRMLQLEKLSVADIEAPQSSSQNTAQLQKEEKKCLCLVFCGTSGCGKSTALAHVHAELETLHDGIRCIRVSLEDHVKGPSKGIEVKQILRDAFVSVLSTANATALSLTKSPPKNEQRYRLLFLLDGVGRYPILVRRIIHIVTHNFHSVIEEWFGKDRAQVFTKYISGWNFVMAGASGDAVVMNVDDYGGVHLIDTDASMYHIVRLDDPCVKPPTNVAETKVIKETVRKRQVGAQPAALLKGPLLRESALGETDFRKNLLDAHLGPQPVGLKDSLMSPHTCDGALYRMLGNPCCVGRCLRSILNPTHRPKSADDESWYEPRYHRRRGDWSGLALAVALKYCGHNNLKAFAATSNSERKERTYYTELQQVFLCAMRLLWFQEPHLKTTPYIDPETKAKTTKLVLHDFVPGYLAFHRAGLTKLEPRVVLSDVDASAVDLSSLNLTDIKDLSSVDLDAARLRSAGLRAEDYSAFDLTSVDLSGADMNMSAVNMEKYRRRNYHLCAPDHLVGVGMAILGVGCMKGSGAAAEYIGLLLASCRCDPRMPQPKYDTSEKLNLTVRDVLPKLFVQGTKSQQEAALRAMHAHEVVESQLTKEFLAANAKEVTLVRKMPTNDKSQQMNKRLNAELRKLKSQSTALKAAKKHLNAMRRPMRMHQDRVLDATIALPRPIHAPDYVIVDADRWLSKQPNIPSNTSEPTTRKTLTREHEKAVKAYWTTLFKDLVFHEERGHSMVIVRNGDQAPEADLFVLLQLEPLTRKKSMLLIRVQAQNIGPSANPSFGEELFKLGSTVAEARGYSPLPQEMDDNSSQPHNDKPDCETSIDIHNSWIQDAANEADSKSDVELYHGWMFVTTTDIPKLKTVFWEQMEKLTEGHMVLPRIFRPLSSERV